MPALELDTLSLVRYRDASGLDAVPELTEYREAQALTARTAMLAEHEAKRADELAMQRRNLVQRMAQDASDEAADRIMFGTEHAPSAIDSGFYDDPSEGPSSEETAPDCWWCEQPCREIVVDGPWSATYCSTRCRDLDRTETEA